MRSDNGTTKKLQQLFHISVRKNKDNDSMTVWPTVYDPIAKFNRPLKLNSDVMRIYDEWVNDLTSTESLRDRMRRYSDLDFMTDNSGYIQTAIKLYANETITPDESGKVINVYAKDKKVEKYINDFFIKIGINRSVLESTAFDIAKYGDSFWIRNIDPEEGIKEIVPIDVKQVKNRIEFSIIDQLNKKVDKSTWMACGQQKIRLSDVVDAVANKVKDSDYAAMYKRYLFGFSIGDKENDVLPPWAISHFRRFSTQSEFAPFGKPLLINSISLFNEYKSDMNLLAMARVAKFPKEVYTVNVNGTMSPAERVLAVNEARQEYENLVSNNNSKEEIGIGSSIWTAKDTIEYNLFQNNMDLGDVDDVELVLNELIASTLVPKGYLVNGEGGWNAGKALLQQSKMFSREVFTNQTALLTELTDIVKTQFVLKNLFDEENTEFELSLSFPNAEQTAESISVQKDTMDLANSTIENLKTALAIDSIPVEVAKDIFKTYSSIKTPDLDRWFDAISNSTSLQVKQADDFTKPDYKESPKIKEKLERALKNMNEDIFREAYFKARKENALVEGALNGRHFYYTYTNSVDEKIKFGLLREIMFNKESLKD